LNLYLDTSVLVTALTSEVETIRVQHWLEAQNAKFLYISLWVETEFSSALAIKIRTGELAPDMRAVSLADFAALKSKSFTIVPVKEAHFSEAALLADQSTLGLRAADALHLAIILDIGATLCTLDKKFAAAAEALNAKVQIV
jgi:uncharacterized protein